MESKESLRLDPKLVAALIGGTALVYLAFTKQHGIFLAAYLYVLVVLAVSVLYFGQQFLRILFMPLMAVVVVMEYLRVKHYLKRFKKDSVTETVVVLAYPNWRTFEAWVKPNYSLAEIKALVGFLKSEKREFSFYTEADLATVETIMRNGSVKEVCFYGHGDSHTFCLSNNLTLFYCDFNKPEYSKQYVHQIHCGTKEGKSLVDYVVPPENRSRCFFFRKSITGNDIVKELKRMAKSS